MRKRRVLLVAAVVLATIGAPSGARAETQCPTSVPQGRDPGRTIFYAKRAQNWFVRGSATSGPADLCFLFGNPGDIGVMGDWNGDGLRTPGVFRPTTATWYVSNSPFAGSVDGVFRYGSPGDQPIAGDWNGDGVETIGVVRGGRWYLTNRNDAGQAEGVFQFGLPTDQAVWGYSWSSRCCITLVVYRASTAEYIQGTLGPESGGAVREDYRWRFGNPGDVALGPSTMSRYGEWGVFRPRTAHWYFMSAVSLPEPHHIAADFTFGNPTDEPLMSPGLPPGR